MNACCVDSWILHQVFPGVVVVGVFQLMSESVFTRGPLKLAMKVREEVHNYEPAKTRKDSEETSKILVGPFRHLLTNARTRFIPLPTWTSRFQQLRW